MSLERLKGLGGVTASAAIAAAAMVFAVGQSNPSVAAEARDPAASPIDYVVAARKAAWDKSKSDSVREKVLGGQPADPGEWPWQVALLRADSLERYDKSTAKEVRRFANLLAQFCGGSLIAPNWVLTAAHCVVDVAPGDVKVLVGTNTLLEGTRLTVTKVIVHGDYAFPTNDIALLKLAAPAYSANAKSAQPVTLATTELEKKHAAAGGKATVTGWGLTGIGQQPTKLMESEIEIFDRAECNVSYMKVNRENNREMLTSYLKEIQGFMHVTDNVLRDVAQTFENNARGPYTEYLICAGTQSGERDSCNGDSGGPLVVRMSDGKFLQIGLVSGGFYPPDPDKHDKPVDCGAAKTLAYYTRLSRYGDWIKKQMK